MTAARDRSPPSRYGPMLTLAHRRAPVPRRRGLRRRYWGGHIGWKGRGDLRGVRLFVVLLGGRDRSLGAVEEKMEKVFRLASAAETFSDQRPYSSAKFRHLAAYR